MTYKFPVIASLHDVPDTCAKCEWEAGQNNGEHDGWKVTYQCSAEDFPFHDGPPHMQRERMFVRCPRCGWGMYAPTVDNTPEDNKPRPKVQLRDGEDYDWTEYATMLRSYSTSWE